MVWDHEAAGSNPVSPTMLKLEQVFIIIGLLLMILELVMGVASGFDLVIIGIILILGGFMGGFFNSIYITLGITTLLGVLYLWLGRTTIKKKIIVATKHTNIDKLIGKKGVVIRTITPDTAGLIRVEDEDWRASSGEVVYEKEKVEVLSIEGVTLIVKKLNV